jgi:hypothetical protein
MCTTPAFARSVSRERHVPKITDFRKLFLVAAMLAATTPSYATTITYNFAARIGVAVADVDDLTLPSVQAGDMAVSVATGPSSGECPFKGLGFCGSSFSFFE